MIYGAASFLFMNMGVGRNARHVRRRAISLGRACTTIWGTLAGKPFSSITIRKIVFTIRKIVFIIRKKIFPLILDSFCYKLCNMYYKLANMRYKVCNMY